MSAMLPNLTGAVMAGREGSTQQKHASIFCFYQLLWCKFPKNGWHVLFWKAKRKKPAGHAGAEPVSTVTHTITGFTRSRKAALAHVLNQNKFCSTSFNTSKFKSIHSILRIQITNIMFLILSFRTRFTANSKRALFL